MRVLHYHVFNRITGKHVKTYSRRLEAEDFVASQTDAENYTICMKWLSI